MVQPTDLGAAPRTRREARERLAAASAGAALDGASAAPPFATPAPRLRAVAPPPSRRELRRAEHGRVPRPRVAFRPDIQGLRALAVTLVVVFHAGVGRFAAGTSASTSSS